MCVGGKGRESKIGIMSKKIEEDAGVQPWIDLHYVAARKFP